MQGEKASDYQALFWHMWNRNPQDKSLVLKYIFKLEGNLDLLHLKKSIVYYINYIHIECNYYFYEENGILYKERVTNATDPLIFVDLRGKDIQYTAYLKENFPDTFPWSRAPLYRFLLIQLCTKKYVFAFSFSHLIFDGVSYPAFCSILEELYNHKRKNWESFDHSMQRGSAKQYRENDIQYWKRKIQNNFFYQPLHFSKSHSGISLHKTFSTRTYTFSKKETLNIKAIVAHNDLTIFHFLTGSLFTLIWKYNGYESEKYILIGHTLRVERSWNCIGCFTNILPLSIKLSKQMVVLDILNAIKQERAKIIPYQHVPFLRIIPYLPFKGIYDSYFNIVINHSPALIGIKVPALQDLQTQLIASPCTGGAYDMAIIYHLEADKLYLQMSCNSTLFSEGQIDEIFNNYIRLINFFYKNINANLADFSFMVDQEKLMGPHIPIDTYLDLPSLFYKSMHTHAERVALVFHKRKWLYKELEMEINRVLSLLHYRIEDLSKPGKEPLRIGIYLERSPLWAISILGAIFSNVCFVPLDPLLSIDRLKYIIHTTGMKYVLTEQRLLISSPLVRDIDLSLEFICIDFMDNEPNSGVSLITSFPSFSHPNLLQYILFTSGSTGQPKGVMISKENLLNCIVAMQNLNICDKNDYWLALTAFNFDIALLEVLLPLSVGATVDIADRSIVMDGKKLIERVEREPVTIIQATPSTYRMIQNRGYQSNKKLKLLMGGEASDKTLVAFLLSQNHTVYNMYGPTETTIWSTVTEMDKESEISIGHPLANTSLYILDPQHQPVPKGMAGELYIGGKGVGLGYLNVSNEPFITFSTGERIYKTGDMVRYYGNGYIKFIGRTDNQVKVRGFRVELSEVTQTIKEHIHCCEAATVLRAGPDAHLIAFIQLTDAPIISIASLEEILSRKLPYYMLPQRIIPLKEFPLTFNLKIDYKKLQNEEVDILIQTYGWANEEHPPPHLPIVNVAESNKAVKEKITTLLSKEFQIFVQANQYDYPLGYWGFHSLSFNLLATLIEKHFQVNVSPHHFYMYNSINTLSNYLMHHTNKKFSGDNSPSIGDKIVIPSHNRDIAVIGIAGKLPQAHSLDLFWDNLIHARKVITVNQRPYLASGFKAGFLGNIDLFDASFFHISPVEAMAMDPQQRLILEISWHCLEDAGYSPQTLEGAQVGVYVAASGQDYYTLQNQYDAFSPTPYSIPGIAHAALSNRLSHFFNWNGPSLTVDTACSGSMVALVRAYYDLIQGVIDFALVASSNIILDQNINDALSVGNFLSPLHRCAVFDAAADGYVRSEGVGCVLLRRAQDAKKAGDHSYGTLIGCAQNHGGRAHSLTAPNPTAQKALLLAAYQNLEVARQVSYIETHGTGTKLGDPIEVDALKMAWKEMKIWNTTPTVALASVKSHIGHVEPAAGMASLLKVLLCLKHKVLPANLHFNRVNSYIDIENSPFYISKENEAWENNGPRIAGISSFGFGGSNAHVIMQEAEKRYFTIGPSKPFYLVCLSAKNKWSLEQMCKQLINFLSAIQPEDLEYNLANIAFTLNKGRAHFKYRLGWIVRDIHDLKDQLIQTNCSFLQEVVHKEKAHSFLSSWEKKEVYLQYLKHCLYLYKQGYELDWDLLHQEESKMRVHLPVYVFHTQPYWFEEKWDHRKKRLCL